MALIIYLLPGAEALISCLLLAYGIVLIIDPTAAFDSKATIDIALQGYGQIAGVPFLLSGVLAGYGVVGNIYGLYGQRFCRFFGCVISTITWGASIWKFTHSGSPSAYGSIFAIVFLIVGSLTLCSSWNNIPMPGRGKT